MTSTAEMLEILTYTLESAVLRFSNEAELHEGIAEVLVSKQIPLRRLSGMALLRSGTASRINRCIGGYMKLIVETIPVGVQSPTLCDVDLCDLDSSVRVTCAELLRPDSKYAKKPSAYKRTPLCTGHAHVVIAEAMVGL